MKQTHSTHWIASTQPRKQRKYRHNAPLHIKGAFFNATLAKDLRQKHATRSLRVRVGDEVKVMRGQFRGKAGKVDRVDSYRIRVFIAGVDQTKRDGTRSQYALQPSNLMITKLTDDKRRFKQTTPSVAPAAAKAKQAPKTKAKAEVAQ